MEKIAEEHVGLEVITMDEFLQREALTGNLKDRKTREVAYPPDNRTKWDGAEGHELAKLEKYLRQVAIIPSWDPEKCMAAFPTTKDPKDVAVLQGIYDEVVAEGGFPSFEAYIDKPSPVDAPAKDRMKENWAGRDGPLCIYNEELQKAPVISFTSGAGSETTGEGARLLVHFYAFIFFEDWKQDLWLKRFVRDHVRYLDEIQCAAARVVNELQERARSRHPDTNPNGDFDTFHIRRGDFQYKVTRFEASKILEMSRPEMTPNATVYIATDERDRSFFKALADEYDIVFLDDFKHLLDGVNTNYYGMMDQLIASRGRIFFGCWFSTFTGYINRLRGYHANKEKKWKGYENGLVPSYYYALEDRKYHMQSFYPVKRSYYAREFPASWRGIDKGIGELKHLQI
jgi:GDP-fucose protein O-fucosyltransferase